MLVKLRNGLVWEVSDSVAAGLIQAGHAQPVTDTNLSKSKTGRAAKKEQD